MPKLPLTPEWLSAGAVGRPVGVDRANGMLRGYVLAQKGPFKSAGRGEFDDAALDSIVSLASAKAIGLKSRFTHPTLSDDGLGKFLGRSLNVHRDGDLVRGDLKFDPTAFSTPSGDLATYCMDLAESDPDALSSSLVLTTDKVYRRNPDGTLAQGPNGEELPPLWRPKQLHASDIVDTGDAVDGLLSVRLDASGLPDELVRRGAELLDRAFAGQGCDVVRSRCQAWLDRYLNSRFDEGGRELHYYRRRLALRSYAK